MNREKILEFVKNTNDENIEHIAKYVKLLAIEPVRLYFIGIEKTDSVRMEYLTTGMDIAIRLAELQKESHNKLTILASVKCNNLNATKNMIHQYYSNQHLYAEWYMLSRSMIDELVNIITIARNRENLFTLMPQYV